MGDGVKSRLVVCKRSSALERTGAGGGACLLSGSIVGGNSGMLVIQSGIDGPRIALQQFE